jgi:molecular chaperone DnaK (HSP70)
VLGRLKAQAEAFLGREVQDAVVTMDANSGGLGGPPGPPGLTIA